MLQDVLVGKKCHKSFMRLREPCVMETGESFMEIETSSTDSLLDLFLGLDLGLKSVGRDITIFTISFFL